MLVCDRLVCRNIYDLPIPYLKQTPEVLSLRILRVVPFFESIANIDDAIPRLGSAKVMIHSGGQRNGESNQKHRVCDQ